MNDVMKKRLIGVAILVIIGVLTPLLLSRCMHGGSEDNGRGSMRVYDVQPDGQAKQAGHGQSDQGNGSTKKGSSPDQPQAAGGDTGDQAGQTPNPDAVSPQSKSGFSTPPVHGDSGGSSNQSPSTEAPSNAQAKPSKSAPNPAPSSHGSADRDASQKQSSSAGSHDYGASSVGSGSSSAGQQSSGSGTSSSASASGVRKSSIQGWVVQVASFSEQGNAADLAKKLKGQFPASYTPGQVNGKTWYRVNVGPFDSKQAAQSAADRLSQAGHKGLVRHLP
ncbi:MAG: SPOR domain-containing protein [Salinisphaera sp.]|uniref:SPOR domain-containing protein n=1 Tax=Salinisphaera sp. TaxID=1914330 RepID=UPI003C7B9169